VGGVSSGDRGIGSRVRPLLADFGSKSGFHIWVFSIDVDVYMSEIVSMAADHMAVTAVPPTRFADDPDQLRLARTIAARALGSGRALGLVDDMSGPFALMERHHLARRLDAGALAELVIEGKLSEAQAFSDLEVALEQSIAGSPAARAV
jgi:glucuronate isomerase